MTAVRKSLQEESVADIRRLQKVRSITSRAIILIALWILIASVSMSPVSAEAPLQLADLNALSLEQLMQIEVSGASKKAVKAEDVPAFVTVITSSDIQRFGYRTLEEALQRVAGMYVSTDRNYDALGARGVSRPGDFNTRILLLVNGHRINDAVYDEAAIGENFIADIENVEQIEVIKGPVSSAWGTNALLGVINVVLKKGEDIDGVRVLAEGGNQARVKGFTEFGKKLDSGLEYSGSLSAMSSEGMRNIFYPEYDSPETNYGVYEHNDNEDAYRGSLTGSYEGFKFLVMQGSRKKRIPTGSYGATFNDPQNHTVDSSTRVDLSYEHEIWPDQEGKLSIRTYFDKVRYHGWYAYGVEPDSTLYADATTSNAAGGELRYGQNIFSGFALLAGAEHQNAWDLKMHGSDIEPVFVPYFSTDDSFRLDSFYLDADYRMIDELRFVLSARYDYYNTFGGELSPRAVMIFSPLSGTDFKFVYGEAFRAPNDYERKYGDDITAIGNDDLNPEKTKAYELIWEQRIESAQLSLGLFQQEIRDLIDQVKLDDGELQFQNQSGITSRGIEAEIDARLESGINAYASLSIDRAYDNETHVRIENSPRVVGALGLSVPVGEGFYLSPEFRYIGDRKTLYSETVTGAATAANLVLLNKSLVQNMSMQAGVYNIFDEKNYSSAGNEFLQHRLPEYGRTFRVQVGYSF